MADDIFIEVRQMLKRNSFEALMGRKILALVMALSMSLSGLSGSVPIIYAEGPGDSPETAELLKPSAAEEAAATEAAIEALTTGAAAEATEPALGESGTTGSGIEETGATEAAMEVLTTGAAAESTEAAIEEAASTGTAFAGNGTTEAAIEASEPAIGQPGSTEAAIESVPTEPSIRKAPALRGTRSAPVAQIGENTYSTMEEAIASASALGGTISMLADYSAGGTIACAGGSFTIDMNGHEFSFGGLALTGAITLTLTDSDGSGSMNLSGTGETSGIVPGSSQTINLTIDGANINSDGVLLSTTGAGSTVTIEDGNIVCAGYTDPISGYGRGSINGSGVATVTINGGSFIVNSGQTIRGVNKDTNPDVYINGGYMQSALEIVRVAKSLTISGGTLYGNGTVTAGTPATTEIHGTDVKPSTVTITGGRFRSDVSKNDGKWVKDEYVSEWDGEYYAVVPSVAKLNNAKKFSRLADAVAAAESCTESAVTIKLTNEPDTTGCAFTLDFTPTLQALTVDKNGHADPQLVVSPEGGVTDYGIVVTRSGNKITYEYTAYLNVTYTDGVSGAAFADEIHGSLLAGDATPPFEGSLDYTGHGFAGWTLTGQLPSPAIRYIPPHGSRIRMSR